MSDISDILRSTAHRPWPLPHGSWLMFQSWQRLLFGHWQVPRSVLRLLVPNQLELDEHDGETWVSLAPFRIEGLRARFLPPIPGLSSFPELNLRTYVRHHDDPGIFFFTLEAASRPAVAAARQFFHLPYRHADMTARAEGEWTVYSSRRRTGYAEFAGRYRPVGEPFEPQPGTLEHFLTERYAFFTVDDGGRVLRCDIHHRPWPLQAAEAEVEINTIPAAHGIPRPREVPLLHYAKRQDTLIWPLRPAR